MISCGVLLELLTNTLSLSLLAYIAVKKMPDRIKLCTFKRQSFYLFYLNRSDTQARWFFESLTSCFHQCKLLQPNRGQCPGRSSRRTILSPQTNPDSVVVLFCPLGGGHGRGMEELEGRQQSLWLIYKSFSSFPCPYTPFLCCFCSMGWVVVTGNCPLPGHYSPDTSHPAA